jgi:hypothetical protein
VTTQNQHTHLVIFLTRLSTTSPGQTFEKATGVENILSALESLEKAKKKRLFLALPYRLK